MNFVTGDKVTHASYPGEIGTVTGKVFLRDGGVWNKVLWARGQTALYVTTNLDLKKV